MAEQAIKEVTYLWEGVDRQGKHLKGEMPAKSPTVLKAELRRQGLRPVKVRKKSELFGRRKKKITSKDITVFSRQLATMMTAGVPVVQALELIGRGHEKPSMQELILAVKNDVESGSALAEALGKHPLYFDDLYCNLVHAGEQAGALETLLHKIATYKEKTESIKARSRRPCSILRP